jgi:hypothetical protein
MAFGVTAVLDRYSVRHELQGPRLRFGFLWFVVLLLALVAGTLGVAALFAVVCSVTALQVAGAWKAARVPVNQPLAALAAGLAPLASLLGDFWSGLLFLAFGVLAVVLGSATRVDTKALNKRAIVANWTVASATLRSGFFVALVGTAAVQIHRVDSLMLLFLLAAACVYDSGDYLCGAGYRNRIVGPIAGSLGVLVVTMSMTAIGLDPLTRGEVWIFGIAFAILCPLGQLFGSWILPSSRTSVPGLRRLDSWLLAAPFFWVGIAMARS